MKTKQNPGYPVKGYNATFEYIHQNFRAYLRSKKIWTFIFLENWEINYDLGPEETFCVWKTIFTIWQNMISRGRQKFQILQLFSKLGKIWECTLGLGFHKKNPIFHLFPKLEKIEKPIKSNIQKYQKLFLNGKNLELERRTNTQKSQL